MTTEINTSSANEPVTTAGPVVARIEHLGVRFPLQDQRSLVAVNDLSLDIHRGEALGIVGESGSGKSMMGLAMLGLVPPPGIVSGRVLIGDTDVVSAEPQAIRAIRGSTVGLILQDATASLNPLRTIKSQLAECLSLVRITGAAARDRMRAGLRDVGLEPDPVLRKRPFELSGGMNQRIAIAMALLQEPRILIADEPTTALDVVVQLEILDLLRSLQTNRDMSLIMISHDLAVVKQLADRVAVMYGGRLVENGSTTSVVGSPHHPYTKALLGSMPRLSVDQEELHSIAGQFRPMFDSDRGCPFADRCPVVHAECRQAFPDRTPVAPNQDVWCWDEQDELSASTMDAVK